VKRFAVVFVGVGALAAIAAAFGRMDPVEAPIATATSGIAPPLRALSNPYAYIPPQCYVKTVDEAGRAHNPCFTCHQASVPPNYVDDGDVQTSWSFATPAVQNRWTNLFVDRSAEVAAISDAAIDAYVAEDNYFTEGGEIRLRRLLAAAAPGFDADGSGAFDGYVPDCYFDFDARGFDRDRGGRYTGWRVFAYYPLPGAFMPTNGSMGDVMIRLPEAFRARADGAEDYGVYAINLTVLEALVRQRDVPISAVDERLWGVDLDRDGSLGEATVIRFGASPPMRWVGLAGRRSEAYRAVPGLFPRGTEFLHSVRYLEVRADGSVGMAKRMKELRYARKAQWRTPAQLRRQARYEAFERNDQPSLLRRPFGDAERGVGNGAGWIYQGFIEDASGALRPQSFEETTFCVGCHGGVGATVDSSFAFARRVGAEAFRGGFYHPRERGLEGLPDPPRADGETEYAFYLAHNGAGDDFRANDEVRARFFDADGELRADAVEALVRDVTALLIPSAARARTLDRAYLAIVRAQSFTRGRDATVRPLANASREVELDAPTGNAAPLAGPLLPE
jgi:hypothetical protein